MITCDINILIDHILKHQHHQPLYHRKTTPNICIDTITINRISIDVDVGGASIRPNGP